MIYYHALTYNIPQAFIEEDDFTFHLLATIFEDDTWQHRLHSCERWVYSRENSAKPQIPPVRLHDEDYWQSNLSFNTSWHISMWF